MRVVVAVHSRDVKAALFLALEGARTVDIVATATTTAELVSFCRSFRPDIVIVESSLPGRPLATVLGDVADDVGRTLVIDPEGRATTDLEQGDAELFLDVDHMVGSLPTATE